MEPTQHESRSSVEISRTAKGEATWSVKVYRAPGEEDEAKKVAQRINEELTQEFYPTERIGAAADADLSKVPF